MRKFSSLLALVIILAAAPGFTADKAPEADKIAPAAIKTNAVIRPGPYDGPIASLVAQLMERSHYSQQPFDPDVSSKFFDKYLEALDPQRLYLFQTDLADFEPYRRRLNELTIGRRDTSAATHIFMRFRDRVRQRIAYVQSILPNESYEFTGSEKVLINRKDEPWPKNVAEAQQLWHERLRYEMLQEKLNKKKPDETVQILSRRYNRTLRLYEELDNEDVLEIYLTAFTHVYDPHSDYMGKSAADNFSIGMKLSLTGIGAVLTSEDGYCKIRELSSGGPAQKSKLIKPNDRIVGVAQGQPDGQFTETVDLIDMKLNKAVSLIRGPKGSEVRLSIIPADAADESVRKTITLTRDEIKLEDQQAKSKLIEIPQPGGKTVRLGVLDLPSFYADFGKSKNDPTRKSTTADVSVLIKKFMAEKVDGLILDLRRNGGGSLDEAISLTGLFIKQGAVVQVRDSDGTVKVEEDTNPSVLYDGPLVVMTSRFSASASEILAGALQDHGRALIVGDISTHGKGTVQSLVDLSPYIRIQEGSQPINPGQLKLTIRKFYRASGASTQLKGVTPDLVLPSVLNFAEVGEGSLDFPMPWDTVPKGDYEALDRVAPHVAELKKRSNARLATDKDYGWVREDIEQYKKTQADKTVSLNEEKRRQEKADAEARVNARKKDFAARAEPKEKIYELTLKLAAEPGLPAPLARTNVVAAAHGDKTIKPAKGITIVTGASTNQTAAASPVKKTDDDGEDELDKVAGPDVMLEETKRILTDYIRLLSSNSSVTTAKTGKPGAVRQ